MTRDNLRHRAAVFAAQYREADRMIEILTWQRGQIQKRIENLATDRLYLAGRTEALVEKMCALDQEVEDLAA
jgi:hypothetical protein